VHHAHRRPTAAVSDADTAVATLVDRVASLNRATAGNWDVFEAHRARLTSLVSGL